VQAANLGIEFVPGVELAVEYPSGRFHMLGYLLDLASPELNGRLDLLKHNRMTRNERMIDKMQSLGIDITLEEVAAVAGGQIGRPHMAFILVNKGVVPTVADAFEHFLADGAKAHVPKDKITLQEGIDLIHSAGGLAVMAHPSTLKLSDEALMTELPRLQSMGLDGLECYYNRYSPARCRELEGMARRAGLLVTGGSDFHGDAKPDVRLGEADGTRAARYELLDALKQRAAR
jgi:predicted metal-dependent phosphoesterase TrpH